MRIINPYIILRRIANPTQQQIRRNNMFFFIDLCVNISFQNNLQKYIFSCYSNPHKTSFFQKSLIPIPFRYPLYRISVVSDLQSDTRYYKDL